MHAAECRNDLSRLPAGLLAGMGACEPERAACGSPLKGAVQIGGEDLSMFDGDDAGAFLLDPDMDPDMTPADA
jgi:hypothetical protein